MRGAAAVCLVLLATTAAPAWAAGLVIGHAGLGSVRLGMTERAAQTALGSRFTPPEDFEDQGCQQARRLDGKDPEITYMIEDGRITRIDVFGASKGVASDRGIGLGATAAQVRAAYGKALRDRPDAYDDRVRHLSVQSPDRRGMLDFLVENGRVTELSTGYYPSIAYAEGCL